MKKHMTISLAIIVLLVAVPVVVFAQFGGSSFSYRPLGGFVVDAGAGGSAVITCPGVIGPLTLQPYVTAVPTPYFIRPGRGGSPRSGGYLLGLYSQSPDMKTCKNTQTGVPVPAYEITLYGTSR